MKTLGIDVGTGGTRAVVVDREGRVIASATAEHIPFASTHTGWAEQNPEDWWLATIKVIREVLAKLSGDEIVSIGFSGQMHGLVLLDQSAQVLRPAIIWCDQRTDAQCKSLTETIGAEQLIELTCNPALTGFTLPKMLWVRQWEPELWQKVRSALLPKDYVRLRLSGDRATDVADASGTLLFDVKARKWSSEMLATADIDERLLARVYESPDVTGSISKAGAEATGLRAGTPVVAGAGDQAAGAVGMGIIRPGTASVTIGTSGVVFASTDKPKLDLKGRVHTLCHAIPNRWHVMGVTQGAGLSLRWFRDQFGVMDRNDSANYDLLTKEAASVSPGSDGLIWTPYLMGERTPHLDPFARAALVGLTASHTRAHIVRAVLEGVAFSLRDAFEILNEMGVQVEEIRLGGGGARSNLWRQIQADVYRQPVKMIAAEEGAALGAALLAGVGVGIWPSVDAACDAVVRIDERIEPNAESMRILARNYDRFKQIYPALKTLTS
ncbi:MAG: xylulokinase [Pyrinomonadaceae bacterium]